MGFNKFIQMANHLSIIQIQNIYIKLKPPPPILLPSKAFPLSVHPGCYMYHWLVSYCVFCAYTEEPLDYI